MMLKVLFHIANLIHPSYRSMQGHFIPIHAANSATTQLGDQHPGGRLTLVFPPLTMPTSPPLGVAMLKGYIERELPQWQVTVIDLNIILFKFLFEGFRQGDIHLTAQMHQEMGGDTQALLSAADAFNGQSPESFYDNPQTYDFHAGIFIRFTDIFTKILHQECAHWEQTGQISPMLDLLVQKIVESKPDILGVSMIFNEQLPIGAMLGRYTRQQLGVKTFFGGSCFTEGVEAFMHNFPNAADAIVSVGIPGVILTVLRHNRRCPGMMQAYISRLG
ncbi:MAG: hypothetical protein EBZ48_05805 [Proteobacteria bacterium]|nr:hypothetical protein [Pseudomonadota bacterium]